MNNAAKQTEEPAERVAREKVEAMRDVAAKLAADLRIESTVFYKQGKPVAGAAAHQVAGSLKQIVEAIDRGTLSNPAVISDLITRAAKTNERYDVLGDFIFHLA